MKLIPEPVTKKQLEILILLYRFRYLNRTHIQTFLHHKSHSLITTYLKDLTDRKIINRIYSQTIGNINEPAIYYLGLKSRPILEKAGCDPIQLKRVYKEDENSLKFQKHWLFIADLYFCFLETAHKNNAELQFLTATDLKNYAYTPLPRPDAYITVKDNKQTKRYFLEVFDDGDPFFAVLSKINKYLRYFEEGYWQDHQKHPFPKILFIYPNPKIKKWLVRTIAEKLEDQDIDISFFLGSRASIQQDSITGQTWEAA